MRDLYEKAIVGIKAHRKAKLKTLPSGRLDVFFSNGKCCTGLQHQHTEAMCAALIFEQALIAALAVDSMLMASVGIRNKERVPLDLVKTLSLTIGKAVQEFKRNAHARPLIEAGVPAPIALSFADLILQKRSDVVAFINLVGDPLTELA